MTGDQLRNARERLGVSVADLAARAGVSAPELARWETSAVPRAAANRLDEALWQLEREAALAKSGLPACAWAARFAGLPEGPGRDLWLLERHIGSCKVCQARGRYIDQHVRPRPASPWLAWLPPFPRAIVAGAGLALVVSGGAVAALILLVLGAIGRNGNLVIGGGGLFVTCALAGGMGGAVHYLTRPLRRGGAVGHYISWVLAVESAVFVAVALIALAACRGLAGLGAEELRTIAHPLFLSAAAGLGLLIGLAVGARSRRPGGA